MLVQYYYYIHGTKIEIRRTNFIPYYYMNRTADEHSAGFRRREISSVTGSRKREFVSFHTKELNPGDNFVVEIPLTQSDLCLVPGSLALCFDIEVSGAKSWFLNNLSRRLVSNLRITLAEETVYDCNYNNIYSTYKDLWLPKSERADRLEYGIAHENLRKLISGDDSGKKTNAEASDVLTLAILGTRQKISLGHILEDHGLFHPHSMNHSFKYHLTLAPASDVLVAQSGSNIGTYKLKNVKIEYETIKNPDLANDVMTIYGDESGISLLYDHVQYTEMKTWLAASLNETISINVPRRSLKAVVLLFTKAAVTDSEEYVYPNIENVKISIRGESNMIYNSDGLQKFRLYDEARRLFEVSNEDQNMTFRNFYNDKFAIVIDLRSHRGSEAAGNGTSIVNTQNGVTLEITKKAHTGTLKCYPFVVSDGIVSFKSSSKNKIEW